MLLNEGNRLQTLGACSSGDVTNVAVGATVFFVAATNGVGKRTTAVTSAAHLTAGIASITLATIRTDDVLDTCFSDDVTGIAVGATVYFVAATNGVGQRTTVVTSAANLTAGIVSWALTGTIGADNVLDVTNAHSPFCNSYLYQHKNGYKKTSPHSLLAANEYN